MRTRHGGDRERQEREKERVRERKRQRDERRERVRAKKKESDQREPRGDGEYVRVSPKRQKQLVYLWRLSKLSEQAVFLCVMSEQ